MRYYDDCISSAVLCGPAGSFPVRIWLAVCQLRQLSSLCALMIWCLKMIFYECAGIGAPRFLCGALPCSVSESYDKTKIQTISQTGQSRYHGGYQTGGDGYGPIGSWRWNFNVCRDVDHKNIVGVDFWSSSVQKSTPTPAACDFTDHYGCQW